MRGLKTLKNGLMDHCVGRPRVNGKFHSVWRHDQLGSEPFLGGYRIKRLFRFHRFLPTFTPTYTAEVVVKQRYKITCLGNCDDTEVRNVVTRNMV
jgi:hypothetical protein